MASFKITHFGGLMPRVQPQNLPQVMAQVALDVDLSRQTLRPWRTDKKISGQTGNYLFIDGCCVITDKQCNAGISRINTDCQYLIASNLSEYGYPVIAKKENGCQGQWLRLGFPIELPAPNAQLNGTLSDDFNTEARQYIYTLVNDFGQESAPSLPSEPMYAHNDFPVIVSGIPTAFPTYNVSAVRIYCAVTPLDYGNVKESEQSDAYFLLVDEIPVGQGTYVHQPHTDYGEECLTEEYEPPADCIQDLQYCGNGQIGGLVGSELWLSEPLKPHAFPEAYRYGHFNGKPLRFLCGERAGYILTDEYPAVIEMQSPCTTQGCRSVSVLEEPHPLIACQSACLYNGSCFYASRDGLVMLSGGQSKVVTAQLWTQDQWQALAPWTMKGVVHDGYYFGFTDNFSFRLKIPDGIHETVQEYALTELSIRPTALYRSDDDRLYFADDTGVYEWNAGLEWKTFQWKGRLNTAGGYTAFTAYKIVQDFAENRVIHTAYKRHRNELVSEPVMLGDKVVQDSRPHRLKRGYSTLQIDVEITGQGEVYEYHLATSVAELGSQ